jgi:hypothetical protein
LKKQAHLVYEGLFSDAVSKDREEVAAAYRRSVDALYPLEWPNLTDAMVS